MRKEVIIKIISQFHEIEREKAEVIRYLTDMKHAASEADDPELTEDGLDALLHDLFRDDSETMEICTEGELICENGRIDVRYSEPAPTGMGETVTSISFDTSDRGLVAVMRGGDVYTALILERGVRHSCVYNTTYVPITIYTTARRVENTLTEDGGGLYLVYTVESGVGVEQFNKMSITVTPVERDDLDE